MPLLEICGLEQHFPLPKPSLFSSYRPVVHACDGIDLDIREGETLGLVGESGCGKSTFGRSLLQLYRPTAGSVVYEGKEGKVDLCRLSYEALRPLRRELQMIFQDPYSSLDPRMTVGQSIEEGMKTHGLYGSDRRARYGAVLEVMEKCGLSESAFHRYPHEFSGGQRQRVAIARALGVKPRFVVCDECVSALDVSVGAQIVNLLAELKERERLTYLFISHDLAVVRYLSDRVGVMYLGKLVELGDADTVFSSPMHPYTAALLSASFSTGKGGERIFLRGTPPSPVEPPRGCRFHTRCPMARAVCGEKEPALCEIGSGHFAACHFPLES